MTGFYRNMATGDYDELRDTEDVLHQQHKRTPKKEKKTTYTQRRFTSDDLRPAGDDDYDY